MKNTAQNVRTVFLALWRGILSAHRAMCEFCLIPVKLYRKYISGLKGVPSCRFTPTCSEYAILAVREWGIVVGILMALFRIIRCNPFSKGGNDPVPLRSAVFSRRNFPGGKK